MTSSGPNAQWRAVDFIHLSVFSFGSTAFTTPLGVVVLPILVLNLVPEELKNTYLGLLGLAGLLVAMVVQPLAGYLSDRTVSPWGRRAPYIMVGGLLTSLSVFALGAASSYALLVAGLMVAQVCLNTALGPYQAFIRDLAPVARRGVVSSIKVLADSSGGVVFLVLVAFILGSYSGPQSGLWLWLSVGLLSANLGASTLWTATKIRSKELDVGPVAVAQGAGLIQRKARPRFGWFLGSRFCTFAALALLQTYAVFFLRDVVGLANPVQAVGTMTIVTGGSLLLAVYPSGRLSDHIGRKPVMVASTLVAAGGALTLLMATSFLHVILISALLGASAGAFFSASLAMATDMVSSGRTAQQMGIANAAAIGGTALAKLAGPAIDLLNQVEGGLGYSALLLACGVFFVLGAVLLIPVPISVALRSTATSQS